MTKKPLAVAAWIFGAAALFFFVMMLFTTLLTEEGAGTSRQVALVRVEGIILDSRDVIKEIKEYEKNPAIRAIVLRIDSPGGAVVPSQEIYDEVKKVKESSKKKIIASMGTVAASGGYYIASASEHIVANPGTLTGSIGVIMEMANMAGLLEKLGVESVVIKSGEHKDLASPFRRMGKQERAILQQVLDDVHDQFIEAVSLGRGLEMEKVRKLADGRIFTGRRALELGLVDELGSLDQAVASAARMAGIEGEPKVIEAKKPFSIFDLVRNRWLGSLQRSIPPRAGVISLQYMMAF